MATIKQAASHLITLARNGFFNRNTYTILIWPVAALFIAIVGWAMLWNSLNKERREAEQAALKQANALSITYAEHLGRTMEAIDEVLLHVRFEWGLSHGKLSLEEMKRNNLFLSSPLIFASIFNRNGEILTNTTSDKLHLFAGDRAYFLNQKSSQQDELYISTPIVSRNVKRNLIPFSRKLVDENGNFDGVVQVAIAPTYLTANFDATIFGKQGFLGIIGADNIIRVTRIGETVYLDDHQAISSVPAFSLPSGSQLFEGNRWFVDKHSRYVGWHPVKGYPLIALVGLEQQYMLSAYLTKRSSAIHTATLATLALLVFTMIAMSMAARLARRKRQLERVQATYRMATEEGKEGFFIARPIRDRNGFTVDFEAIDCNQRGAEFFQRRRETLIGKRVSSFAASPVRERLLRRLRKAEKMGFYEENMKIQGDQPGSWRWLHIKIVCPNDDLAITMRDITDAKSHVAELQRRSDEDPLTRLPNRNWIQSYLPRAIDHAKTSREIMALLFIDLDGFKAINDAMGHRAGDELLCYAAQRLKIAIRPEDHVVRWGGDEFIVIIEHIADKAVIRQVAGRILHAFEESFRLENGVRSISTSIGISIFPTNGVDAETLLHNADVAMYSAKTAGKAQYRLFEPRFYEALRARLDKEIEIRNAIENDQFVLYYQPRVDLDTETIVSMEALVRWAHPTKGVLSPIEFIPLAEETNLILDLGELIINKVCHQLADWAGSGQTLVPVSINVSPRQFHETNIRNILSTALRQHGVSPVLIEIEVTETSMMGEHQDISRILLAIQELGVKICIDDFGTGYSSLSQLQRLDFDVLKIDQAFTAEIGRTDEGCVFVKAIITMAHALEMRVVAEGVENETQARILKSLQCDEIQGFYIARPLPPAEMQPILAKCFPVSATQD